MTVLTLDNPEAGEALGPAALGELFDLGHHLRHVDAIFERVFGPRSGG